MTLGAARVIFQISDLSSFVDAVVRGYVFAVVEMQRGELHKPRIVSSTEEYRRVCGLKTEKSLDPLVVEMGLRQGARFILSRTAHYTNINDPTTLTALKSSVTLYDRGETPLPGIVRGTAGPYIFRPALSGRITASEVAPYTFGTGTADAFSVQVGTGDPQNFTLSGSAQTAQQVCDQINAATNGLTAEVIDNKPRLRANNIGDGLSILAVANDAYSVLGFLEGIYGADPGTSRLVVSVSAGADQTVYLAGVNGEIGAFSLTSAQVGMQLAGLTGCAPSVVDGALRITTTATGPAASIQVKATSTAASTVGFDNEVHAGVAGAAQACMTLHAKNPGKWGDSLLVQPSDSPLNPETRFNIKIIYKLQGELQETFPDLSMDPKDKRYFVNYINERSDLVWVDDEESENPAPSNRPAINLNGVAFSGGDDGGALVEHDYIGNPTFQSGLYAADKNWNLAMDIMVPGTTSITVYQALIAYCESRGDMIGYGMIPFGMTPEEAVDYRLGNAPWTHPAFNSHRFCLLYGYPVVYDDMDDTRKYVSCLGHYAACLCRTDNEYGQWYAPAGAKRGKVILVEDIDFNVQSFRSTGWADLMADNGINYLFISQQIGNEDAMFWEQRTTQRTSSALRNLNVVRFITMVARSLLPILKTYIFDPNHPRTWREIHRVLEPAFENWKTLAAIYDYAIQSDRDAFWDGGVLKNAKLNSGLSIDQGRYICRVLIQPTEAIYYLEFTLGVMATGENFEKWLDLQQLPGWVYAVAA